MTQARSPSIAPGLVVELSRCKVLPGASAEADRWMAMLNDRLDECVATLDREHMARATMATVATSSDTRPRPHPVLDKDTPPAPR